MDRQEWGEGERSLVRDLVQGGHTPSGIATILSDRWGRDVTRDMVSSVMGRMGLTSRSATTSIPVVLPSATKAMHLEEGEGWAIYGDPHHPATDWVLFNRMCLEAERLGIPNLLCGGDFWNFRAFSKHVDALAGNPLRDDLVSGRYAHDIAGAQFRRRVYFSGNHDLWAPKAFGGKLDDATLQETFKAWLGIQPGQNADWSNYGYCFLTTKQGKLWRVSHPRNYSRRRGAVAGELAVKYRTNIIHFHIHRRGIVHVETPAGFRWGISLGCMADPTKLDYAQLVDSTAPEMEQGFLLLKNGVCYVYGYGDDDPIILS